MQQWELFGFSIGYERGTNLFNGLDLFIFLLTVALSIVALYHTVKKGKEVKEGQPAEDELSLLIKYKAGYEAYQKSMLMWLFIFLLKDKFPNVESMLGGGILLSALIFAITKYTVKNKWTD